MGGAGLFARIEPLFDVGHLAEKRVAVVGCGSGGGSVALQLVMSGIRNFTIIDNDVLGPENVIRHVCGLRYVGRRKTDALEDVLKDRNPSATVEKLDGDVLESAGLEDVLRASDVVVLATDNDPTRWRINEACVRLRIPFCVGRVFTRGIGGEVFAFRPGSGGCLGCLETVLQRTQFRTGIREIDLVSEEERNAIYGMDVAEIKDSPGLNVDISFITAFHTRLTLDALARGLPQRPQYMVEIPENYIVWGNRPVPPFERNFQMQRITLHPIEDCRICGKDGSVNAK